MDKEFPNDAQLIDTLWKNNRTWNCDLLLLLPDPRAPAAAAAAARSDIGVTGDRRSAVAVARCAAVAACGLRYFLSREKRASPLFIGLPARLVPRVDRSALLETFPILTDPMAPALPHRQPHQIMSFRCQAARGEIGENASRRTLIIRLDRRHRS